MGNRVFVTGLGILSSIGNNLPETIDALKACRSGIGTLQFLKTPHNESFPFAEVPLSNDDLMQRAYPLNRNGISRNALLGIIAAKEATKDALLDQRPRLRSGLISATTVGGMDQCERYYKDFMSNNRRNEFIDGYDCADSTERIAECIGITDYMTTISTACSSAANAILLGARMISNGLIDRVVAGGTEALTGFHINGFNALKILDKQACRPFDANRGGITLGEGAAYVVLESEEAVEQGNPHVYATLLGYGNSCEAFHQTASAPDGIGAYLAMKKALDRSGLTPSAIDYINAHGTGTDNNDLSEGMAIEKLFGEQLPLINSTKPITGHTTSAAGSIESIVAIISMQERMVLPNLNYETPMPELHFQPVTRMIQDVDLKTVMTNSFGFGGNDTSLIYQQV
jgi:3-oxoacyl-(acyl-carrier-protein) synthase